MKKLLFILFILPVYCFAQSPVTPAFVRKIPIDSLIGYKFPGVTSTFWLPDTAWVKKHAGGTSGSFINNGTSLQTGADFNISGSGKSSTLFSSPDMQVGSSAKAPWYADNVITMGGDMAIASSPTLHGLDFTNNLYATGPTLADWHLINSGTGIVMSMLQDNSLSVYQSNSGSAGGSVTLSRAFGINTDGSASIPLLGDTSTAAKIIAINSDGKLIKAPYVVGGNTLYTGNGKILGSGTRVININSNKVSFRDTIAVYDALTIFPSSGSGTSPTVGIKAAYGQSSLGYGLQIFNGAENGYILAGNFVVDYTGNPSGATLSAHDSTNYLASTRYVDRAVSAHSSGVESVSGTTNRVISTGGTTPVIDISSTFEALLGKVANPLSQFAATTSAQLLGVISDETGTGKLVFGTSPTFITPVLGTPASGVATNITGLPLATGVTGILPIANGGTGTVTPGIVAGTNITVTGTWPNQTVNSSGGGSTGVNGLNGTTNIGIGGTLSSNSAIANNGFSLRTDSLYLGTIPTFITPSGSEVFFGTSITVGTGITGSGVRYSTQVAKKSGFTEVNVGTSGAHIQQTGDGFGFQDHESSVIAYTAGTTRWLIVEVGPNDFNSYTGGAGTYQPTTYQTDLTTCINYLITTKGWPANKILILNNSYFNSTFYTGTKTPTVYAAYQAATLAVATAKGTLFLDINSGFAKRGGDYLMSDNLHPANQGHTEQANEILSVLSPSVVDRSAQQLAVNGLGEFANLKLNNNNTLPDAGNTIVGRDKLGNLGNLSSLPDSTRFSGSMFLTKNLQSVGAAFTGTLGTQDWLLGQQKIYSALVGAPGSYTTLQLANSVAGFTFQTSSNAPTNSLVNFINGAGSTLTQILQNGTINTSNIVFPGNTASSLSGTAGGGIGEFLPFASISGEFATVMRNSYSAANLIFATSRGVNATSTEAGRFAISGNFLLNTKIDDGFNLEVLNNSRFQNGIGFGRLTNPVISATPTASGTGGVLAAATYFYKVVAVDAFGNQTLVSNESSVATTGTTSSVSIPWTAVTNATSYRVYQGTTANGETKYFTASASPGIDIGSGYTTLAPPTQNQTVLSKISAVGDATFKSALISGLTASKVVFTDASKNLTSTGIGASSQYIAGDGSLSSIGSKPHIIFTPTTGGTVTLTNNQYNIINPAGALLALTVTLPSSPANNDCVFIKFTQNVTTVTYSGGTVVDGITAPTAGGLTVLTYDSGTTSWY